MLVSAPSVESQNSQFRLPTVTGRIEFSLKLKAMILRIEGRTEAVKKYFLSDERYEIVKYDTPFCYRSGYGFKEDIDLLCFVLEECQRKTPRWLRKLSKTDYNDYTGKYLVRRTRDRSPKKQ